MGDAQTLEVVAHRRLDLYPGRLGKFASVTLQAPVVMLLNLSPQHLATFRVKQPLPSRAFT